MTKKQIQILNDHSYYFGEISREEFIQQFGPEVNDISFIKKEVIEAIKSKNKENIEGTIKLIWFHGKHEEFIDELNLLLVEPNHISHQVITKQLQDLANPKSIPFIKQVLESNFDYLEYTCSESESIAKWFSWALFSIGTKEAIALIKEYTKSNDEGIRNEMIYRLKKVNKRNEKST